jgi:hypothetical protein
MKIVVNHLTRMRKPAICVAGWNTEAGGHVRPVLPWEQLDARMLARNGGPFAIGRIVELGRAEPVGQAPEVEDFLFDPRQVRVIQTTQAHEFWALLQQCARTRLRDVFGNDLDTVGTSCAVPEGRGIASLGCFVPKTTPDLYVDRSKNRVRMSVEDGVFSIQAAVTDLRLYERDLTTPRKNVVERMRAEIRKGVRVVLSVGLGRPWKKEDDTAPRHWMQVNNIHLESHPVW